jgi:exopolysaccharide production protein ExoQ
MPPIIATLVFAVLVASLFFLDRDTEKTSKALWIAVVWMMIIGSRPVTAWLGVAPAGGANDPYLDGSPIDRDVFLVLIAIGVAVLVARGRKVSAVLGQNLPILIFYGYCGLSILWSDFPDIAAKRWIKFVGDLAMVLIVMTDDRPVTALRRLLARCGFVLLPGSILLIKYFPNLGWGYEPWSWTPIFTGVTTNKNSLGLIAMLLGLSTVWQICNLRQSKEIVDRQRHLIAQSVLFVFVVWILHLAHSTTSTSCFVFGSFTIVVTSMSERFRKPGAISLLVFAIVFCSFLSLFVLPQLGLLESVGKDATLTGRTDIWRDVLAIPVSRILGAGFDSFWLGDRLHRMWELYWWHPNEAHNGYLEILLNLGYMGLFLLMILFVTGYRNVLATLRQNRQLGSLCLAFFTITLTYNFTEAAIRELNPVWFFFLVAMANLSASPMVQLEQPSRVTRLLYTKPQRRPVEGLSSTRTRRGVHWKSS